MKPSRRQLLRFGALAPLAPGSLRVMFCKDCGRVTDVCARCRLMDPEAGYCGLAMCDQCLRADLKRLSEKYNTLVRGARYCEIGCGVLVSICAACSVPEECESPICRECWWADMQAERARFEAEAPAEDDDEGSWAVAT